MNFLSQLTITIADKLIIGLIVLFVGFILNKKLETFKSELQALTTSNNNLLQRIQKEHEIRFTNLQEKRARVIAELYYLLEEALGDRLLFDFCLEDSASPKVLQERARTTYRDNSKLESYYRKHKLYFSCELSAQMEKVIEQICGPISEYFVMSDYYLTKATPEELKTKLAEMRQLGEKESPNVQRALKLIEKEFRVLLGSDSEEKDNSTGKNSGVRSTA